ncbi:zinc ribbon domain-containing protein [Synechococcus sp. PCC 6717]|nr:zinc ribbon domain-containing protein [Synechococcus sp. PCC 6717]
MHIGLRTEKKFKCGHCGWIGDADLNGAINIALLGQSVTLPGGSWLACEIESTSNRETRPSGDGLTVGRSISCDNSWNTRL